MSGFTAGASVLAALLTFLNKILGFFEKTPEEKVEDRQRDQDEANHDLGEAEKEGRAGDTSKIEDIINH